MATSKSDVSPDPQAMPASAAGELAKEQGSLAGRLIDRTLELLSSVRFGLVMLGILLTCSMIGMLVMQISVEGFQRYYNALSPAKKLVYGSLGFFDIYHSWY